MKLLKVFLFSSNSVKKRPFRFSVDLKLDAIASNKDLRRVRLDLITKNAAVARQAAQVLQMLIELVDFDVLETLEALDVPEGVADIILSQSVLDQIDLVLDLHCEHLGNDDHLAELAKQVLVVGQA